MLRNTALNTNNIYLADYNKLFDMHVNVQCVNDIYDLNILPENTKLDRASRKVVDRILYHYIIDSACTYILKNKTKPLFIYNPDSIVNSELFNYINIKDPVDYIVKILSKVHSMTGLMFSRVDIDYSSFNKLFKLKDGETIDHILSCINKHAPFDLYKLNKFINKNGLNILRDNFFKNYKYKLALI